MRKYTEEEIIQAIKSGKTIHGIFEDKSLEIKIKEYVPYICTAIHAGNNLREELSKISLFTPEERKKEEDLYTNELISSFPVTLTALDSRFEYDLNRNQKKCVYEKAWGKKVYNRKLTKEERAVSLDKHARFYRILNALVFAIKEKFENCLIIDIHSFNWQTRLKESAPVFDIRTLCPKKIRRLNLLEVFEKKLKEIRLPNIITTVDKDTISKETGYMVSYVSENLSNTTIIPLGIKKIYMDELTGDSYPLVIENLRNGLFHAVLATAAHFTSRFENINISKESLLPKDLDPAVIKVDTALGKLAGQIDTLQYVNPINLQQEKKKFLERRRYEPKFHYRQLRIDPYEFREKLYKLPVSQISDPPLRELYRSVIDSFAVKIELLTHIGTPSFLYNSLRYYGEPSSLDIANAKFLLHAAKTSDDMAEEQNIDAEQIKAECEIAAKNLNIECNVILSSKIVANAMVDGAKRTLLINKKSKVSRKELTSLIYHELGVHMTTTINARKQPLKVFIIGLPQNTYTQEGLAIMWEYLSNSLNLDRLRQLALRVLAVEMMIKGMSFSTVFHTLNNDYRLSVDAAFTLTTRVFRGGGFTKDYLYLSGFRDIINLARKRDISPLLTGKVSIEFIKTLDQLIERKIVVAPDNTNIYNKKKISSDNQILDYLVSCIK
ncbi:MAG: flavohemoglobin expression-modulating QEGLA motif protein [Spirochaetia bacterium]|nr:flavohemoglobin expression-modulating QEGLA motif protein [Spirochaetia bacterium]